MNSFDLRQPELTVKEIHRNLPPSVLYEHAIRYDKEATIAENGALVAESGQKTGRSPKDKRIVKNSSSEAEVWLGNNKCPTRFQLVQDGSTTGLGLSQLVRQALLLRWLCRLGSQVPRQRSFSNYSKRTLCDMRAMWAPQRQVVLREVIWLSTSAKRGRWSYG